MEEHWGRIIWRLLHVLVEKIDEKNFNKNKAVLIELINYIGTNLPCGMCSHHYKKNNYIHHDEIYHKYGLIIKLWDIHNNVNTSREKEVYSIDVVDDYDNYDLSDVVKDFKEKIGKYRSMNMDKVNEELEKISWAH
jgi:hypothetical protein